jgi:uncharacterized phage protein (TIGR01671 family)
MQRKIKVRVWSKSLERFLTKDEWFLDFDGNLHFRDYTIGEGEWATESLEEVPDENYIVQQFTGLSDKNGKEIYEGDTCIYIPNFEPAPIVFSNTLAGFVFDSSRRHNIDKKYGDYIPMHREYWNYYEVVGNVFENPELV